MDGTARLLRDQDGVVARRQLIDAGRTRVQIARSLRRGELVAVLPGVYVEHNGPLAWQQRAWAGVLTAWPAALYGESALRASDGPGRHGVDERVIHVLVERDRRLHEPPGVRIHRVARIEELVLWNLSPPRVRYEDAVLDIAAAARNDLAAVAALADACGSRRTTAERLLVRLRERPRIARRRWLDSVLADVSLGTCSVLEHGYQTRVVRPTSRSRP